MSTSVDIGVAGTCVHLNATPECIQGLVTWAVMGTPFPIPDIVKKITIIQYAFAFSVRSFVETGTFLGTTTKLMADHEFPCKSIELSDEYYSKAVERFASVPNVELFHGDSGEWLGQMTDKAEAPHLFWLDSHYSGGGTARGSSDTPIARELNQLIGCNIANSVILIDDVREFGKGDYPPVSYLDEFVKTNLPEHKCENYGDIFRITPKMTLLERIAVNNANAG
jgi:hypothetical protein